MSRERGRRTLAHPAQQPPRAARGGLAAGRPPRRGRLSESCCAADPDAAVALLADLAAATDPQLRVQARRLAARLFVRAGPARQPPDRGFRRLAPGRGEGDLDLDLTLEVAAGRRPKHADQLVTRRWTAQKRALCLLVDHSGSMQGHGVALAAMAAAAVVLCRTEQASTSVIAFAADALVLQRQSEPRQASALVDDLLSLRGKGRTNLALALKTASQQLARDPAAERTAIVLSDCRATAGGDPFGRAARARSGRRPGNERRTRRGGGGASPRYSRARALLVRDVVFRAFKQGSLLSLSEGCVEESGRMAA